MKYYLICKEYTNEMAIKCYSNDDLIVEKKISPLSSVLVKISDSKYEMNDVVFGINCILHIRKNSDFYFVYKNKKPMKISFKSFITTLKDIINGEN